jgi:uncharacterized protein HemX
MRRLVVVVLAGIVAFGALTAGPALAQSGPTSTVVAELPPPEMIPRPNSGSAPQEAGDRGGALQLGLLALVVVVIGGGVANLVRQSRRARTEGPEAPPR